jgi:hypothetical protein
MAPQRLTVEFGDDVVEKLERIGVLKGLTKVDVLRQAIALYDYALRETAHDGLRLSITKGGKALQDIVLP